MTNIELQKSIARYFNKIQEKFNKEYNQNDTVQLIKIRPCGGLSKDFKYDIYIEIITDNDLKISKGIFTCLEDENKDTLKLYKNVLSSYLLTLNK